MQRRRKRNFGSICDCLQVIVMRAGTGCHMVEPQLHQKCWKVTSQVKNKTRLLFCWMGKQHKHSRRTLCFPFPLHCEHCENAIPDFLTFSSHSGHNGPLLHCAVLPSAQALCKASECSSTVQLRVCILLQVRVLRRTILQCSTQSTSSVKSLVLRAS